MNPSSSSSSPRAHKSGDRRRKNEMQQKVRSSTEKIDQFRPFWNSMSLEEKQSLFQVSVSDLKKSTDSISSNMVKQYVSQAISFVQKDKTWKFWSCCLCRAMFLDSEPHMMHVQKEHIGKLRPEFLQLLPQEVNSNWVEMLLKCPWKPVEASAAVKVIEDQSKCHFVVPVDGSDIGNLVGSSKEDSVIDKVDTGSIIENRDHDDVSNDELMQFEFNEWPKVYSLAQSWPLSSDSEREDLLERIHNMFKMLLRHKYLATTELSKVIQYTKEKLQGLTPKSRLLNHWLSRTPLGICFLGASELKEVLKQLQDYSRPCGLPKNTSIVDETHTDTQNSEVSERIVLTDGLLPLVLDERLLCNLENSEKSSSSEHGATETYILTGGFQGGAFADSDALLSSIFTGPTSAEQWLSWIRLDTEKIKEGMEVLQILRKEFSNLLTFCERKFISLSYMNALEEMESDEAVLQKRKLVERDKIMLDVISNVLKEAKPLLDSSSHVFDLESGKDGDGKTQDCLDQNDTRIKEIIQRQKDARSVKLSKIDASIMHNVTVRQQLELKLGFLGSLDYQTLILPSVKTIIQARLEALVEKDAAVKSAAASEALLELVLDEKKSLSKGGHHSKPIQEKSKNKKKKKNYRKPKDSKVAGDIEPHAIFEETAEQGHFPDASDQDSKTVGNISSTEDFNQQEEELRLQMEAAAIQLEENLEYQRRVENEAKQKHFAGQYPEAPQEPYMPEEGGWSVQFKKKKKRGGGGGLPSDVSLDFLETAEQGHFPAASDQDSKTVGNICSTEDFFFGTEDLKQHEKELRRQMEAAAIQVEENLEYQRRKENEAKQKHLAEPNPEAPQEQRMKENEAKQKHLAEPNPEAKQKHLAEPNPEAPQEQRSKENEAKEKHLAEPNPKTPQEQRSKENEAKEKHLAEPNPEAPQEQRRKENEAKQKHLAEPNPEAPQEPYMPEGGGGGLPSDFSIGSLEEFPPLPCASSSGSATHQP